MFTLHLARNSATNLKLLSYELIAVQNYTFRDRLKINFDNSTLLVFSFRENIQLASVRMANKLNNQTGSTTFLGVFVDERSHFKIHAKSSCSKWCRNVGVLLPQILKT